MEKKSWCVAQWKNCEDSRCAAETTNHDLSSQSMQIRLLRERREIRRRYTTYRLQSSVNTRPVRAYRCRTESGRLDVPPIVRLLRGQRRGARHGVNTRAKGSLSVRDAPTARTARTSIFYTCNMQCACSVSPRKLTPRPPKHPRAILRMLNTTRCTLRKRPVILRDQGGTPPHTVNLVSTPGVQLTTLGNLSQSAVLPFLVLTSTALLFLSSSCSR